MKSLHAVQFDGITFGMPIKCNTKIYRDFKKAVAKESFIDVFGNTPKRQIYVVPYLFLAVIMDEVHWLVSEDKCFNKITIEDFLHGEEIYVKYSDESVDFRTRRAY